MKGKDACSCEEQLDGGGGVGEGKENTDTVRKGDWISLAVGVRGSVVSMKI